MKKTLCAILVIFLWTVVNAFAVDSPAGKWKTINEETKQATSIIEIYEQDGVFYGKIIEVLKEKDGGKGLLCDKCSGDDFKKPIVGLVILKGLKKSGNEYSGGTIVDAANGKIYKCSMEVVEGGAKLKVRGYIGFSLIGRNQFWERVK